MTDEPVAVAALLVSAAFLVLVLRTGLMALLDRFDGGWHRSSPDDRLQVGVLAVALAGLAAVLWLIVGIRALLD